MIYYEMILWPYRSLYYRSRIKLRNASSGKIMYEVMHLSQIH